MYDLPSEDVEEPGLPDEYHALQPQLLNRTFRSPRHSPERVFMGTDLNLYYDVHHLNWYKRPDWFLVVGVPRLYDESELRSSYVFWQEGVSPFVVVELLSPGTAKEDLGDYAEAESETEETSAERALSASPSEGGNGQTAQTSPPRKWEVYEKILRVPYYVVFSRLRNQLHFFELVGGHYQEREIEAENPRFWIEELELGLGLWLGEFEGIHRQWLRWYDREGNWVPTDTERERLAKEIALEQVEREQQRAEQAETQLGLVVLNLLHQGMSPEQVANLTGLSLELVRTFSSNQD
jgi:Uma2 family endonuclease